MRTLIILFAGIFFATSAIAQHAKTPEFENYKTKSLEMEFFSPLTGNLTLGYEQVVTEKYSLEGRVGLIGLGVNYNNQRGGFVKGGMKIRVNPVDQVEENPSKYMEGSYLKPEFSYAAYSVQGYENYGNSQLDHFGSLQLVGGFQNAIADVILTDFYMGLGYGFSTRQGVTYPYSQVHFSNNFPLTVSGGISVGILLK